VQNYALTERGKLFGAVLVVVVLLAITTIIFAVGTASRDTASGNARHGSNSISQNGNESSASVSRALLDMVSLDIDAGIMTFPYTPGLLTSLDDNTVSLIGALLSSPENTENAVIAVEIPQLSDDDTATLTAAMIDAFNTYEVPLSDIIFTVYQPEQDAKTFKIGISFR